MPAWFSPCPLLLLPWAGLGWDLDPLWPAFKAASVPGALGFLSQYNPWLPRAGPSRPESFRSEFLKYGSGEQGAQVGPVFSSAPISSPQYGQGAHPGTRDQDWFAVLC